MIRICVGTDSGQPLCLFLLRKKICKCRCKQREQPWKIWRLATWWLNHNDGSPARSRSKWDTLYGSWVIKMNLQDSVCMRPNYKHTHFEHEHLLPRAAIFDHKIQKYPQALKVLCLANHDLINNICNSLWKHYRKRHGSCITLGMWTLQLYIAFCSICYLELKYTIVFLSNGPNWEHMDHPDLKQTNRSCSGYGDILDLAKRFEAPGFCVLNSWPLATMNNMTGP